MMTAIARECCRMVTVRTMLIYELLHLVLEGAFLRWLKWTNG